MLASGESRRSLALTPTTTKSGGCLWWIYFKGRSRADVALVGDCDELLGYGKSWLLGKGFLSDEVALVLACVTKIEDLVTFSFDQTTKITTGEDFCG